MSSPGVSIFIVEDQPLVKAGLIFMLEELENVEVIGDASDGLAAVADVLDLRPSLTLMDISLPGQDGISATKQIKQSWPDAKIMLMTGHENDDYVLASFGAGADGYCLKNTNSELLAEAVNIVLHGGLWLSPSIAQRVRDSYFDQDANRNLQGRNIAGLSVGDLEALNRLTAALG